MWFTALRLQVKTLAELEAQAQEAQGIIADRYAEFSKYRDDTIEVLQAADERIQHVAAVRMPLL